MNKKFQTQHQKMKNRNEKTAARSFINAFYDCFNLSGIESAVSRCAFVMSPFSKLIFESVTLASVRLILHVLPRHAK